MQAYSYRTSTSTVSELIITNENLGPKEDAGLSTVL